MAVLVTSVMVCAGTASADLAVYNGSYVDMYLKPNTFPDGLNEEKVYLDEEKSPMITGHVGSQTDLRTVTFSSTTDTLDAKNGFATIKAVDGYLNNITITAPGYLFTDLIFSVNLVPDKPAKNTDLTVIANSIGGIDTYSGWAAQSDWVNGENRILVLSTLGNQLMSVTINSLEGFQDLGGLDQLKQTEISGFKSTTTPPPVPIPAAVWLLGSGLLGLAGIRRRFMK